MGKYYMNQWHRISHVDEIMGALREYCLGLDTPLKEILVGEWDGLAGSVSSQLLFQAALRRDFTPAALEHSQRWLYQILRFLTTECARDDHTFAKLLTLCRLDQETLTIATQIDLPRPAELEAAFMEEVILELLERRGLLDGIEERLKKAEGLLFSSPSGEKES